MDMKSRVRIWRPLLALGALALLVPVRAPAQASPQTGAQTVPPGSAGARLARRGNRSGAR